MRRCLNVCFLGASRSYEDGEDEQDEEADRADEPPVVREPEDWLIRHSRPSSVVSFPEREKADGRYATGLLLQLPAPKSGSAAIRFLTQALLREI